MMNKLKEIWDHLEGLPDNGKPLAMFSNNYRYLYRIRDSKTNFIKLKVVSAEYHTSRIFVTAQYASEDGIMIRHKHYVIDELNINQFVLPTENMDLLYDKT